MNVYTLDIDLKNRTAKMLLPYFTVTLDDSEIVGNFVQGLIALDSNIVTTVSGNTVDINIMYDFGIHLPSDVWKINESLGKSMKSFLPNDKSVEHYFDNEFKQAIADKIQKDFLPVILGSLQEDAVEFSRNYFSK